MKRFNDDIAHVKGTVAFMKTDDDTLVLPDKIVQLVEQTSSKAHNYYIGISLGTHIHPRRDPSSRWYEPKEVWPRDYPLAMSGAGYILNARLIHRWCTDDLSEI